MSYREPGKPGLELEPEQVMYEVVDRRSYGTVYMPEPMHKCQLPNFYANESYMPGYRFHCAKCKQWWEVKRPWFSRRWEKITWEGYEKCVK